MQSNINFVEVSAATLSKMTRHYYITGGYKYKLNTDFVIEPSACIKYAKPAPLQFDLGVRAIYHDKIWLGGVYRYLDAVSALVGYKLQENITFVYSYDFTTSNIRRYSSGTHELMIAIKFHKVEVKAPDMVTPQPVEISK